MPLCSRRAWKTFQGPLDPSRFTTWPTPGCYDGIVPPTWCFTYTDHVFFRPSGGLMVVAICWPIARGDRQIGQALPTCFVFLFEVMERAGCEETRTPGSEGGGEET